MLSCQLCFSVLLSWGRCSCKPAISRGVIAPTPQRLTIVLLGSHAEHDANILDSTSDAEAHTLGLCTGLLSAVAAATARSTNELLKIAPEIVCISLRLALEADHRSAQLENSRKSWAVAVPGMSATDLQTQIEDFHQNNVSVCLSRQQFCKLTV